VTEHANSAMHGQRVSGGSLRANSGKRTGNTRAERAGRQAQCLNATDNWRDRGWRYAYRFAQKS
jgi:hypothetical protein